MLANSKKTCSAIGHPSWSRSCLPTHLRWTHRWPKPSASRLTKPARRWTRAAASSTPNRSKRVEYKIRLDALVRRQIIGWKLSDSLLVDVHLYLNDELPRSPTSFLRKDPAWFGSDGMVYGFDLID